MSKATASYASLPKQAPPQKAAPTQPLPPLPTRISPVWDERFVARPRSRTFSNIASWALSKEGYKKKTRHARDRPLPLAAQLELAQLMDGGSLDRRIQAHMAERARAEGGLQRGEQAVGVGDVWRDGAGGIWLDQEEEWEYAHLLAGEVGAGGAVEPEWVDFEAGSPVDGEERRGSVSTQSSELSPSRLVQALEGLDDGMAIFGGSVPPVAPYKPGKFALSLPPARRSSSSDSVPRLDARPGSSGSARKRPAPLVLPLPSPTNKRPINSPINPEQVRRDFLENSDSGTDSTPRNQRRGSLTVLPGYVNTAAASEEALSTLGNRKVLMKKSSLMNLFKTRKD
ncbi:hypothetical protein GLOTRDRAFT_105135 [Gloeophyllum trabeum ATCC 11539]|uniref:Uncharacterized protein n=1 Tax=Gloeophyllum trabeum (strain ATCC 11539 / FP-39264 / Madison 617) TaxID=670483 RepID=S7Q9V8_GLOTA|nr:uncharacterized protein GLOTRDRAFT_105135 [Gloeophyllum trabeum ATCC 11539]EPQ56128.1 hypothetical protein GLOTRDRAFT_105135 [Gloeophyllum trabeum ATCC 11539]